MEQLGEKQGDDQSTESSPINTHTHTHTHKMKTQLMNFGEMLFSTPTTSASITDSLSLFSWERSYNGLLSELTVTPTE